MIKLLLEPMNLLILDEPTNHLDMKTKDILKDAIKAFDGTVIVVSHDREFLDGLVNKVYVFGGGKVIDNLSSMGVAMNSDEAFDKVTDLVGNTKGFKDFKACSPKSRAYIISSNNKLTSKLYEDISKQCADIRNEVKLETEKVKENVVLS